MSGDWYGSWSYNTRCANSNARLRIVPRQVALTQSERIHDILCRLSRQRRIEQDEAESIARQRAGRTSWGAAGSVVSALWRNYWIRGPWFYQGGNFRTHNLNMFAAIQEAVMEKRPFLSADYGEEDRAEAMYQTKCMELCQLESLLTQLRKEIRNECIPA